MNVQFRCVLVNTCFLVPYFVLDGNPLSKLKKIDMYFIRIITSIGFN